MLCVAVLASVLIFCEGASKQPSPKAVAFEEENKGATARTDFDFDRPADFGRLLRPDEYEGDACSSDDDCGRGGVCNYEGFCEDGAFPCYDSDECRGKQVCDMARYICVDPTPAPTAAQEPGCCAGDSLRATDKCNAKTDRDLCDRSSSCHFVVGEDADCSWQATTTLEPGCCFGNPDAAYSKRWMEQCTAYYTQRDCQMLSDAEGAPRCRWESLGENYDCSLLWPTTTTTTQEVGCCHSAESYKANDRCSKATERARCEDMGCEFLVTADPSDCELTTTETPTTTRAPGCCLADSARYVEKCLGSLQRDCERMNNCDWLETDDASDCELTTTTEEPEPGCCMGETKSANERCVEKAQPVDCERTDRCNWNHGEDADCTWPDTPEPEEPGCCYGNPALDFSARWMDACVMFATEKECLKLTNGDGAARCTWQVTDDDCEVVWPTTTTTTEEVGCCYSADSYKANGKCARATDRARCEDMGCDFLVTDDPNDCIVTTTETPTTTQEPGCCAGDSAKSNEKCNTRTEKNLCLRSGNCEWRSGAEADCSWEETTTAEPGCCLGNPNAAYSKRWMTACAGFFSERDCELLSDSDGEPRCVWEPLQGAYDCSQLWPTTTTTTEEVGCCYSSDSYKANGKCARATDRARCESMGCAFLVTDDTSDCEMTTTETPTTTIAPGCCRGLSFRAQDKCFGVEDQTLCERKSCEWVVTDDASDCELTTTTEEPEPGCCMGDSKNANERCVLLATPMDCERSTRCNWNHGEDADCTWPETPEPEMPGCCFGNPDLAFSARWMTACVNFFAEDACLKLTNGDGEPRCQWQVTGDADYDCELLWPTTSTSTLAPGCCRASSYKAQDKCVGLTDQVGCERKDCEWLETDDPTDCAMTTTATPTTTSEPWMGAKPELEEAQQAQPAQPKPKMPKAAKGAAAESALFGGEIVGEGMNSEVSLTTVLLLAAAAFVVLQAYRWWSTRKLKNQLSHMQQTAPSDETQSQYYQGA